MDANTVIIIAGIVIALAFNFSNGRNDASNTVATVIATRALAPRTAILIASICCLAGPFIYSTAVAKTIGKGSCHVLSIRNTGGAELTERE